MTKDYSPENTKYRAGAMGSPLICNVVSTSRQRRISYLSLLYTAVMLESDRCCAVLHLERVWVSQIGYDAAHWSTTLHFSYFKRMCVKNHFSGDRSVREGAKKKLFEVFLKRARRRKESLRGDGLLYKSPARRKLKEPLDIFI